MEGMAGRGSSRHRSRSQDNCINGGEGATAQSGGPVTSTETCKQRSCLNGSRRSLGYLEELEKERCLLLAEIEREEREKDWYYAQLQNLTKRIDGLPLADGTDATRRELELEAHQIRSAMEERLGTCQAMAQRAQVRVSRIKDVDREIARVRLLLQESQSNGDDTEAAHGADGDARSMMSFGSAGSMPRRQAGHLGTKVEMVYSLLSMLGTHDKEDMSRTLLAMSSSQDSCVAMRQSGCLPLLIQLLHSDDRATVGAGRNGGEARGRAGAALHNIVHSQPEDRRGRREMRVLHLIEQIRAYCDSCWEWSASCTTSGNTAHSPKPSPVENQIGPAICVLMKLSFDEDHRHAMNELGGLQAIGELLEVDCDMFANDCDPYNVTLRRYAGMALTNLTFGDVANKAMLCSMKGCMKAMVAQLRCDSEDLRQVIASVLRNLSWRADVNSKRTLRDVGSVAALMSCALEVKKESTLKSVLSALWNLSAHCTENKADICGVDGALAFLVGTLSHRSQSNTLAIIESGGGILRNVSSLVATNDGFRQILRDHNCLPILLQHLKSHSLTIVSNACGTLWNLSARNARDQETLWDLGATAMLKNLIHSKHRMIAMGSAAALRNLMANRPPRYRDLGLLSPDAAAPGLHVRRQRALEAELQAQDLAETFDNLDNLSPRSTAVPSTRPRALVAECVLDASACRRNGLNVSRAESTMASLATVSAPSEPPRRPQPAWEESRGLEAEFRPAESGIRGYLPYSRTESVCKEVSGSDSTSSGNNDDAVHLQCYGKYPPDLARKIHSANHLDEACADSDTPINYSLKYSDEQLNSGRQSPSRSHDAWSHPEMPARAKTTSSETHAADVSSNNFTSGGSSGATAAASSSGGFNTAFGLHAPCPDDYEVDDKPTNYGQCYSEEEEEEEEEEETNLTADDESGVEAASDERYSSVQRHAEPIDYSLKFSSDFPTICTDEADESRDTIRGTVSLSDTQRTRRESKSFIAPAQPKGFAVSGSGVDKIRTYCVEGTPICFSRCSSLSSLSSTEDGERAVACSTMRRDDREPDEDSAAMDESIGTSDTQRCKIVRLRVEDKEELVSGAKSPSKSGAQTPKSPLDPYVQETPLVFSRCSSVSSLDSFGNPSIASSVASDPNSELVSGIVSPSELPDSPGRSMPPSRAKTPPPPLEHRHQQQSPPPQEQQHQVPLVDSNAAMKQISLSEVKQRAGLQPVTISEKVAPVWDPVDRPPGMLAARDGLLHFATEATPDGFSCASSLSGLSIDEPPINKDSELWASVSLAAVQEEKTGVVEMGSDRRVNLSMESPAQCVGRKSEGDKSELLEDSDDDADILKECINSAMPTKSLASKTKKEGEGGQKCPATQIGAKRESQLPLFRKRIGRHTTVSAGDGLTHDTPHIYHTEGTQSAFSAATSLSDLTIDSSTDEPGGLHNMGRAGTRHSEGDILAECISAAMPKGRSQRPHRVHRIMVQAQQSSDSGRPRQQQHFVPSRLPKLCRESFDASGKSSATGRPAAGFAADSPHHFTPIEGTPYCFSRNDSLSSLDFDDDDGDLSKAKEELKKDWRHLPRKPSQDDYGKRLASTRLGKNNKLTNADVLQKTRVADRAQGQPVLCSGDVPRGKSCSDSLQQTESTTEERLRSFAVEDTPVCFSRNSSLSSLSDIDRDDNGNAGGSAVTRCEGPASVAQQRRTALQARGKAGDTSRAYRVEGTPACFSRNSSLSSLSVESEDDLLQECISSAMPQKRRTNGRIGARVEQRVAVDHSGRRAVSMDKEGNAAEFRAENVASPESESFDWKAIQEGANSIVSSLHQAAAAAAAAAIETPGSLSRQASSDSDSILSLVSGLSLGSPLHAIADREDSTSPTLQNSTPRGPRISKDKAPKASLEAPKAVRGGKKVYRSGISGKARPNVDSQTQVSQSLSASVAIRGRANTPSPALRNPSANTSAAPKKGLFKSQATSGPSGLTRAKVSGVLRGNSSGSVNRSISAPARTDGASLIKPSPSGRGGITVANNMRVQRSAARSPAPLSGRMSASPASTPGASRLSASPARNSFPSGLRRASATGSRNGGSSPSAPSSRSSSSSNLACLTSSNGGTNLAYARPTFANRTRTSPGGSKLGAGNSGGVRTTKGSSLKRTELTQAASTRSSESESEHAEKPVSLVRQSTFVKEAPSPDLRDALKASSASCESVSGNRGGHKHMEKSQDLFGLTASGFRSRSRSPGHVASGRNGTWKREGGSRPSSSLPRVGTWRRAGSSSSILSASSESSDKTRGGVCGGGSEGGTDPPVMGKAIPPKELKQPHGPSVADSSAMLVKTVEVGNHGPTPPSSLCGLWRKTSDPAETQEHLVEPPMAPAVSKTEDVWVRIEDCPINSPRSGKLEEGDDKAPAFSLVATPDNEMVSTERTTPLSSANSSKHSSPGGSTTVSARVTPFNYTPSPQRRGASEPSTARPSQIPTPVPNKRRDPSKTITSPEAAEDAKVHSGSFLVTSV